MLKVDEKEGNKMRVGIIVNVDNNGRIVIPKEYREFYHMNRRDTVRVVDTPEGLLITNPKYKVVKIADGVEA